jgi:hypothetical protein
MIASDALNKNNEAITFARNYYSKNLSYIVSTSGFSI